MIVIGPTAIKIQMETTVTKIKDLVTVHADTAFALFPIDSERYELCAAVAHMVRLAIRGRSTDELPSWDPRIKEVLDQTRSNFVTGARAFVDLRILGPNNLTDLVVDRARRCEASVRDLPSYRIDCMWDRGEALDDTLCDLWAKFFEKMVNLPQYQHSSQEDRRNPT